MSGNGVIDHEGIVEMVDGEMAKVVINSQSACASCHAKGACGASGQEAKELMVPTRSLKVQKGEKVRVLISKRTGMRAVAYGYVYPFLLLLAVLIILSAAGMSELQAGLSSLASLVPYYLVIYILRDKIGNSFTFTLEKTNFDL